MTAEFYDAGKFQVVERKWFALPKKWGGDAASGFSFGTHDPGTLSHVEKWYPAGAIDIKKIGVFVSSTSNNASGGLMNFRFLTRGASASVVGTLQFSSATESEGQIAASKIGSALTVDTCKKGEYITIQSFEPTTKTNGTEVKATTSGATAFFIDYTRKYVVGETGWDKEE